MVKNLVPSTCSHKQYSPSHYLIQLYLPAEVIPVATRCQQQLFHLNIFKIFAEDAGEGSE